MEELRRHDLDLDPLVHFFDDLFNNLRRLIVSVFLTAGVALAGAQSTEADIPPLFPGSGLVGFAVWATVFVAVVIVIRRAFSYRVAAAERLLNALRYAVGGWIAFSFAIAPFSPVFAIPAVIGLWAHYVIRLSRRTAAMLAEATIFSDDADAYRVAERAFFDAASARRAPLRRVRADRLAMLVVLPSLAALGLGALIVSLQPDAPDVGALWATMAAGVGATALYITFNALIAGSIFGLPVLRTIRRFLRGPLQETALVGRPAFLLLRSFQDDARTLLSATIWAKMSIWRKRLRLEESVVRVLERRAPVIAIGEPGERLPQLGAVRAYPAEHEWRDKVLGWMANAEAIVMVAGQTPGVAWELRQITAGRFDGAFLLLFPPEGGDLRRARLRHIQAGLSDASWIAALDAIDPEHLVGVFLRGPNDVVVLHGLGFHQSYYDLACILAVASFAKNTRNRNI